MRAAAVCLSFALVGCGGAVGVSGDGGDSDATTPSDAESSSGDDAHGDAATDARDGIHCRSGDDCFAGRCVEGQCCNGAFDAGVCFCGSGPACDVNHTCCVPKDGGFTGPYECLIPHDCLIGPPPPK
jgi:hypothetical protein